MKNADVSRTYDTQPNCPIAKTLDIVGERWTILILRDLAFGVSKFKEILRSLEGIPANLLARRLQRLEAQGIVERSFYSQHPPRAEYKLTAKGQMLVPLLRVLAEWGSWYELSEEQKENPVFRDRMAWIGASCDPVDARGREPPTPAPRKLPQGMKERTQRSALTR